MRKRIYEIIDVSNGDDQFSSIYDYVMIICIMLSVIPLAFKEDFTAFRIIDIVTVSVFILDYIMRWLTADCKYPNKGTVAFLKYPFSLMAIIDFLTILPSFTSVNAGLKLLRVLRMNRALRVLRILKAMRYSKSFMIISNVLKKSKDSLIAVGTLAVGYILISALIIFNVEPDSFSNFFDAIYWATISLTTVGYGDIYAVPTIGRMVTMLSSVFGIAIVALPAGIITAGYMYEIEKNSKEENKED